MECVIEMAQLMRAGKQLIYIYETQFHKQQLCERVWVKKSMTLRKPDGRGKGVTLIGAISEKQGLIHYMILQQSNNADTFANFIAELIQKIKGEAYVYMNNLTVHDANKVKKLFNDRVH